MNRTIRIWMTFLLCLTLLLASLSACENPELQADDVTTEANAESLESSGITDSDETIKPSVTDSREWSERY